MTPQNRAIYDRLFIAKPVPMTDAEKVKILREQMKLIRDESSNSHDVSLRFIHERSSYALVEIA